MKYRKLTSSNDFDTDRISSGIVSRPWFINQPEAVAQAVQTGLCLSVGEWPLDISAGTPWKSILGAKPGAGIALLRQQILATQGVNQMQNFSPVYNRDTRQLSITAVIDTVYGSTSLYI